MEIRKETTNLIKVIAIFLVIFGHLKWINNGGIYGVSLFLIISGYGISKSTLKNGLDRYWNKRITTVLIPYSVLTLVVFILDFILNNKYYGIPKTVITILGGGIISPFDGSMWYITYILYWYLIFYLSKRVVKNSKLLVIINIILGFSMYIFISIFMSGLTVIKLYSLMFPLGILMGNINNNLLKKTTLCIISLIVAIFSYNITFGNDAVSVISLTFISLFIILTTDLFYKENKIVTYISNISFYMYLFEGILIWEFGYIFEIDNYAISVVVYFMAVIILATIYKKIYNNILMLIKNKINLVRN